MSEAHEIRAYWMPALERMMAEHPKAVAEQFQSDRNHLYKILEKQVESAMKAEERLFRENPNLSQPEVEEMVLESVLGPSGLEEPELSDEEMDLQDQIREWAMNPKGEPED